jgi:UPF0755 protein
VRRLFSWLLILAALLCGGTYYWLQRPLDTSAATLDLSIEPGMTPREVAQEIVRSGVTADPALIYWFFRLSGKARQIKAGSYEITTGTTALGLLNKIVRGEESLLSVTLVEGWNLQQVREALKNAPQLKQLTALWTAQFLMEQLGRSGEWAEGRFFPDTYTYAKGSTDLALLERAARAMDHKLQSAWAQRSPQLPLQTPDQALILASIIEKETGHPGDRPMIAAVFSNRLRLGMRLQTDPTVIYGMGAKYDGALHRSDLLADTAWNTYTRAGLPPTPIAMPGKAALLAAVQPAPSNALYFVARGDGSSHFSATLDEHNKAVNKYLRNQ